jgi:hypothetical protein
VILIPEIRWSYEAVARDFGERTARGRRFSIVVIAEGAPRPDGGTVVREIVAGSPEPVRLGGRGPDPALRGPLRGARARAVRRRADELTPSNTTIEPRLLTRKRR